MQRRTFMRQSALLAAGALLPGIGQAAQQSPLIYISPFKSNGALSRCQAEVWFVQDNQQFYVVTAQDAWRAEAVRQGLTQTQIWVGDVGQWQRSDGRYKQLPKLQAQAELVQDASAHARLLETFGAKYASEWGSWGPRFERGLADGSRVMLRYTPQMS